MNRRGDLVYGIHPVSELLKSRKRKVLQLFLEIGKTGKHISDVVALARRNNIRIDRMDRRMMDQITGGVNHQGAALFAEPMQTLRLHEAIELDKNNKKAVWLAVDEITDPQNLGTMLRSAACLGVTTVVLPGRRTVGITPVVHKTACGALETIRVVNVPNLNQAILELKDSGFWVYGADMSGKNLREVKYNTPSVLVIGSEGTGLRLKTSEHCDEILRIPQSGGVQSLNAACACSIILYDMFSKNAD